MSVFQTPKLKSIYPKFKSLLEQEIYSREQELMDLPFFKALPQLEKIREKVKAAGLWAPHLKESHGGMDLSLVEFAQISELLGSTPYGHYCFNCQAPDIGNMELLLGHASEQLKEQYLTPLMKGEIRSCFGMTEPEFAGSNPVNMATTAIKKDQQYLINGHKWFTTAADGAAFAVIMAVTDADHPSPYKKASLIIVPTDTPGFQLVRNIPIMGEAGEGYMSHAEIRLENCQLPGDHLIGHEGSGFALAQERLGPGRIHHCMRWIGICERAFDMMCTRAANRKLSEGRMLGHQQTVQNWIAECRAEINAARYSVLHTANKIDLEGAKAAKTEISTIKYFVAQVLGKVLDRAIQTHGALGITDDTLLSFWYRHERGARIYDGPDEVHKSVVARAILKGYGLDIRQS